MKVMLINGSPKANGNTAAALKEAAKTLKENGVDTELVQLGSDPIRDCIGCGRCYELGGKCVFDEDIVNTIIEKAKDCDGFIFGSPVYYAHPSGRILSALDRIFYAGGANFTHKPGAAVVVARRGGTTASFDVINKYFTINQMPVVSSTYWNNLHGRIPGEAEQDAEGMRTMRVLARNMAWMLKCIQLGKEHGIVAPETERGEMTNFIR